MALVSCQKEINCTSYFEYIDIINCWFESSSLHLNIEKTKELCLRNQSRKVDTTSEYEPVVMKEQTAEQVSNFKYLGTIIEEKLNFESNVEYVHKKA